MHPPFPRLISLIGPRDRYGVVPSELAAGDSPKASEPKRPSKGRKRALGGIGLGGLQSSIVGLAREISKPLRIRRLPAANEARLLSDELQVLFIPEALGLTQEQR